LGHKDTPTEWLPKCVKQLQGKKIIKFSCSSTHCLALAEYIPQPKKLLSKILQYRRQKESSRVEYEVKWADEVETEWVSDEIINQYPEELQDFKILIQKPTTLSTTAKSGPIEWEVDNITEKRLKNNRLQYKVHWKGFADSQDSWEPAEHLENCKAAITEFEKKYKDKTVLLNPALDVIKIENLKEKQHIIEPEPEPEPDLTDDEEEWYNAPIIQSRKKTTYKAFKRGNIKFNTGDTVVVSGEGNQLWIAHILELYEKATKEKLAFVRWLLRKEDITEIPLPKDHVHYHELYFSSDRDDIVLGSIDSKCNILNYEDWKKLPESQRSKNTYFIRKNT